MVPQLGSEKFAEFRAALVRRGYNFEDRPHQVFLARGPDIVVNLYQSGKIVIGGSSTAEKAAVNEILQTMGSNPPVAAVGLSSAQANTEPLEIQETHVGSDEAGKGDYFGPLVVSAVMATPDQAKALRAAGVKDSKSLRPDAITRLAEEIRTRLIPANQWRVVKVPPEKYNALQLKMENLNRLLAWAHARAIEDVLAAPVKCEVAVADQFGDTRYIEQALFARARKVSVLQTPKAERDVVVAAASILARDEFVRALETMGKRYGVTFPRGASQVEEFARELVAKHGSEVLLETAKIHFVTTQRVTPEAAILSNILRARAAFKAAQNEG